MQVPEGNVEVMFAPCANAWYLMVFHTACRRAFPQQADTITTHKLHAAGSAKHIFRRDWCAI